MDTRDRPQELYDKASDEHNKAISDIREQAASQVRATTMAPRHSGSRSATGALAPLKSAHPIKSLMDVIRAVPRVGPYGALTPKSGYF